jgi:aldose 1-epimerase
VEDHFPPALSAYAWAVTVSRRSTLPWRWSLRCGAAHAEVDAVGAALRTFSVDGRDLVVPYPAGTVNTLFRGAVIAPWPNRVVDGRYTFGGRTHQLPITEVERGHALHGLVSWVRWEPVDVRPDGVTLWHPLVPQPGYPFALDLTVDVQLSDDAVRTTLTARNVGSESAPYGCCPHPYVRAGAGTVDDWELTVAAGRRLEVDERLAPAGLVPVADADTFATGRRVGSTALDHAFTDLQRDAAGLARVRVMAADGHGVQVEWGPWAAWVQLHSADRPEPEHHRVGLAVEPMSCPPNAFVSGTDLVVLQPGGEHAASWTIRAL